MKLYKVYPLSTDYHEDHYVFSRGDMITAIMYYVKEVHGENTPFDTSPMRRDVTDTWDVMDFLVKEHTYVNYIIVCYGDITEGMVV